MQVPAEVSAALGEAAVLVESLVLHQATYTRQMRMRALVLPLLDESDEPMDDENLIDYGLDSVRMMALAARWRKVHGDIDFVMLAKKPTIDAWWALLSREVK